MMSDLCTFLQHEMLQHNKDTHMDTRIPTPRFTGLFIPAEILEIEELTHTDHMLLAWIDALQCPEHGGCFAGNEYLAKKLNLKIDTVKRLITKLVDLGFVERISFDGRQRILRTCRTFRKKPEKDKKPEKKASNNQRLKKSESTAEVDYNPGGGGLYSTPGVDYNPPPSYIDNKEERKEDKHIGEAKASEVDSSSSKSEFSDEVKDIYQTMLSLMQSIKPDFEFNARSMSQVLTFIDYMIRIDQRSAQTILDVFKHTLSDSFWCAKLFKPNPAKYLREKFDQLEMNMRTTTNANVSKRTKFQSERDKERPQGKPRFNPQNVMDV